MKYCWLQSEPKEWLIQGWVLPIYEDLENFVREELIHMNVMQSGG